MAVADQPHVTIPKGPEEAHTPKGLFTRHDFVACDKLTTGLRHDLRVVSEL